MLYFVATPIGNLKEITVYALEKLQEVDCIYAENPRHTLTLLNAHNIKKPVYEYQKFNEKQKALQIIEKLKQGQKIAVVSDAGTPLISDPGSILRDLLIEHDLPFTLLSGACAMVNALVLSGLPTQNFYMAGFLPTKQKERTALIDKIKHLQSSLVFYVAVHDVKKDIEFLYTTLGARCASLVREISKKFEQTIRFTLDKIPEITLKGEFVLVVEGYSAPEIDSDNVDILQELKSLIKSGTTKKEAIKLVANNFNLDPKKVYAIATQISLQR